MPELRNLNKFNITCKKCNGSNITTKENGEYIDLVCLDCKTETKRKLNLSEIKVNPIIQNLLKNNSNIVSYVVLNQILEDSKKALQMQLNILDTFNKKCSELSLKENMFYICNSLKNLNVLSFFNSDSDSISINLKSFNSIIPTDKSNCYNVNYDTYSLKLGISSCEYEAEIEDVTYTQLSDFSNLEKISSDVEILRDNIEQLETLLKSI